MGPDLMAEMRAQAEQFGAEIIQGNVTTVDLCAPPIRRSRRPTPSTRAQTLIIATGASARLLGLPSERALMGHGVSTCATCDGYFFRGQRDRGRRRRRLGDGGGGVPHPLRRRRSRSSIAATRCARRRSCRTRRARTRRSRGCSITEVDEIKDTGKGEVTSMVLRSNKTGETTEIPVHGVFVAIGHTPNTALFRGQLETRQQRLHRHARRREDQRRRASSPAATSRITSTARRSPPPAPAAWRRSTPSTISTTSPNISQRLRSNRSVLDRARTQNARI